MEKLGQHERTIKSILSLNKQGVFNHNDIFKKFLLILRQVSAQIDKKAMTITKNGFHDHPPNFAKLPLPEEGNTTILFHKYLRHCPHLTNQ